jgi:hypothetical protein
MGPSRVRIIFRLLLGAREEPPHGVGRDSQRSRAMLADALACCARTAATCVRVVKPNFARIFWTWPSAVRGEITKCEAISLLDIPRATSIAISCSRGVRGNESWCVCGGFGDSRRAKDKASLTGRDNPR